MKTIATLDLGNTLKLQLEKDDDSGNLLYHTFYQSSTGLKTSSSYHVVSEESVAAFAKAILKVL